ncbi:hypothetical protein D3C76_1651530 [compost metagenome]
MSAPDDIGHGQVVPYMGSDQRMIDPERHLTTNRMGFYLQHIAPKRVGVLAGRQDQPIADRHPGVGPNRHPRSVRYPTRIKAATDRIVGNGRQQLR